jgi:hypothetical protein
MNNDFSWLQVIHFTEHPIVDFSQKEPSDYDITAAGLNLSPSFILNGSFCMTEYNQALIIKITNLPSLTLPDFIDYQCNLLIDPLSWLDNLETLIEANYEMLKQSCKLGSIHKIYINIQSLRLEFRQRLKPLYSLNNAGQSFDNRFDFPKIMADLSVLTTYGEKKAYLISLRADLLEKNVLNHLAHIIEFINIELERFEKLENLSPPTAHKSQIKSSKQNEKVRIHGNVNILADIFYQFLYEYRPLGKPYLDCPSTVIADFISDHFLNSDGDTIPISTILTILSPGKSDKRPNIEKRIKIRPE